MFNILAIVQFHQVYNIRKYLRVHDLLGTKIAESVFSRRIQIVVSVRSDGISISLSYP